MAKPGLSFENPLYQDANGVPSAVVNPFGFQNAAASSGSDALRDDLSTLAMMGGRGVQLARQNQFTMPEMRQPPSIAYSPSRKEFFVQGTTFAADDAQGLLQAEALLGGAPTGLPTSGDWSPLDVQSYGQLVQNVRNPSLGTLAARNFGRGVDQLQMLAGRGLQLAGAEETGGRIVGQQMEDLRRTAPYERKFTDIESGRDAVEWFVANLAQQGPNLIESVAVGLAGAAAGTAAAGPGLGTAAGTLAGLVGKKAFKDKVLDAATKYRAGTASATDLATLRNASALTGAVATSYASNLASGASDIYGEMREQGVGPEDAGARMVALAGSVPYAALESLGEFLLASRILGGAGPRALPATATRGQRGAELLRRGAAGFGVGAGAEGTTELGQEALVMGLSGQDLSSPEAVNRFINAFAAGAAIGGPIGGIANLRSRNPDGTPSAAAKEEVSLLDTTGRSLAVVPPTQPPGPGTALAPYYTPVTPMGPMGGAVPPAQLTGPGGLPQLPAPIQPITPIGGPVIVAGMGPGAVAYQDQMLRQQANVPPGAQPGSQGVLDIFGGQISAQELASRMQPPVAQPQLPAPVQPPEVDTRQGALQFAGPAPAVGPANVQMANQLQIIQDRARRQREFEAAQAQQQALIQQQTEELARQSANARDLYAMQQAQQQAAEQQPMPMRQAGPTQPVQLDLFNRRQAPRPSRAEALRRGVGVQPEPAAAVSAPLTAAQRRAQLPLFTQEGEPSVAALKGAGKKTKVALTTPKPRATKTAGARGLKKGAKVAEVTVREPSAAVRGVVGKPVVSRKAKAEALKPTPSKKEPPPPKVEAAVAAPSVAPEGPIAITLELSDGTKLKTKDANKLRDKLDKDIVKFETLLACLKAAT